MSERQRAMRILRVLGKRYTERGKTDLGNPKDTLLATLLAAQTTDAQVLKVYPTLKKRFPTFKALAAADVREIEKIIGSLGFYKTKARHLKQLARMVMEDFGGTVPKTMEELVKLPGVGRKTASVVLACCFSTPAIAVDTHATRISRRLGWTKQNDPVRIERDLKALFPESSWTEINRVLVAFGRDVCKAPTPQCWRCPVAKDCPYEPKTKAPKRM